MKTFPIVLVLGFSLLGFTPEAPAQSVVGSYPVAEDRCIEGPHGMPEWAPTFHRLYDRAWKWCEDPKLIVGVGNDIITYNNVGLHVQYDGRTLSAPSASGFYYLLLGVQRGDGTEMETSTHYSLDLALEGSAEHGCDEIGYDQLDVSIQAHRTWSGIEFKMDVSGTAYMLFPGTGTLLTREVGDLTYRTHDIPSWPSGSIYWPPNLDDAVHVGSSLGPLYFDAQTSMPGMHFQKHGGSHPMLEIDLDHICSESPLPVKPEFTFSMSILPSHPSRGAIMKQSP